MTEPADQAPSALHRLCAEYGISTAYDDIRGRRIRVEEATLIALLDAFGVDAGTPEAIDAAEDEARNRYWGTALPPVASIRANVEHWSLQVRLQDRDASLNWIVVEEGGHLHRGEFKAAALQETARVERDGTLHREFRLEFGLAFPAGYHRLSVEGVEGETLLVAAPERCYRPPALADGGRIWGPAVQLYALRSERNWGMGDFGDLGALAEHVARLGADIIGLNPLHALFPHNPAHASPYSPSSRLQLNVLYLDVEAIEQFRTCETAQRRVRSAEFQRRLADLRASALVDYPGVAAAKYEILELLYLQFREYELVPGHPHGIAFREFQNTAGTGLRLHATCEALQAHFHAERPDCWGWPVWPEAYRQPGAPAVADFVDRNIERIEYFEYLQWQAAQQLARVSGRCDALGLSVGLYLDLAVSVDSAGSDTWTCQDCYAPGVSVGAPPDEFNPGGQGWGLPPLRPDRLRAQGYRVFIETLRKNMRNAGALRIDHVMGLMRLFWIPPGKTAREGTYVRYALEEMLAIVALESERNRCMVIGEDLGTVADEVRVALARREVLSYRLLYFERGEGGVFKAGSEYPRDALVAVSTHDLATLGGWWAGRDLELRLDLGLFPDRGVYEQQLVDRAQERVRLMLALQHAGLLPVDAVVESTASQALTPALVEAVHAFVARTPSKVMMVQIEDVIGVTEQANMPGTTVEHPNWKRKLPEALDCIAAGERFRDLAAMVSAIRSRRHPMQQPQSFPTPRASA